MPTFSYDAKNEQGSGVSGLIEALAPRDAAAALREQGLWPTRIEPMTGAPSRASAAGQPTLAAPSRIDVAPFLVSVPLPILSMMYRQFATLLNAGVPIVQGLSTLADQTSHGRLTSILREAALSVAAGNALSTTLERYPSVFTAIQLELIHAGEMGGMMDVMCVRIADYLDRETEIRRKLKRETLYPKIVLAVAGFVLLILGFVQAGMGSAGVASVVGRVRFAATVAALGFGGWWLFRFLNQFPAVGATWDHVKMLVPGTGGVARKYATARFARALATLYGAGVLLPRAVESSARACGNRAIGERLLANVGALHAGEGISGMLQKSGLLSPLAVQMARTGEQTGNLDAMMNKVADYLESEADAKSHQLAVFAGVAALLIAALVVLFIAVSFYAGQFSSIVNDAGNE